MPILTKTITTLTEANVIAIVLATALIEGYVKTNPLTGEHEIIAIQLDSADDLRIDYNDVPEV